MSTYFSTAESAKNFGISMAGVDPSNTELTEDNSLEVQTVAGLWSDPNTEEGKERIERDLEGQKGYRLKNNKGREVGLVVAPFRGGFCVWGIDLDIGAAIRF